MAMPCASFPKVRRSCSSSERRPGERVEEARARRRIVAGKEPAELLGERYRTAELTRSND